MKIYLSCFLFFLSFSISGAQPLPDSVVLKQIAKAENADSRIVYLTHTLTDVIGPRLTNSPGYRQATDWAVSVFKSWGLAKSGKESWGEFGKGWSNQLTNFSMTRPYNQPVLGYSGAWSKGTGRPVRAGHFA